METAEEVGNLEKVLENAAAEKRVKATVYMMNDCVYADIDSGHAGRIALRQDTDRECRITGFACSNISGGNNRIEDALAGAGIYSEIVQAGPERKSEEVRFAIEYIQLEKAVGAIFRAYCDLTPRVI